MTSEKENDLLLVSNVNDMLVSHYIFNFSCNFEEKCFQCYAVLFLQPVLKKDELSSCKCNEHAEKYLKTNDFSNLHNEEIFKNTFKVILDCHKLFVLDIDEITLNFSEQDNFKYIEHDPSSFHSCGKLNYLTDKWSLKIWKDIHTCKLCFPKCIRICYKTVSEGPSLLWATDQDKNPAVFTHGAWVNNRSLFPCQEPPSAMATWEATVSVDTPYVVLMSGDEDARIKSKNGRTYYYYFTKHILPLSTLCLAVGFWLEHQISSKYKFGPKCRIFAPRSLIDKSIQELFEYAPYCLKISEDIFGSYPFPRIDFLIVPPTFGSLGMASPNIVFLSQSLLSGDSSLCSRIAHEIAHGWFGLLIGASDWTEEWLSEGFATFVEDYFHVRTINMKEDEANDYIEIKTYIRLKTLLQEISNTNEDLQVLRPSKGESIIESVDGVNASVLKNGQNPIKAFIQVHYIKGYFLLKHLSNIVGIENFLSFLKGYIDKYRGKLVTSKDFLTEFFTWFSYLDLKLGIEEIYDKWLHCPGVADELQKMKPSNSNELYRITLQEVKKWRKMNCAYIKRKNKRKKFGLEDYKSLTSDQQILLLENMLEEPRVSQRTLEDLNGFFNFSAANAEVQHRWFELVVKYRYRQSYTQLKQFLTDHLAMGVYLFGEMIFSKNSTLHAMAEELYFAMKSDLEPNYVTTIQQMLEDVDKQ